MGILENLLPATSSAMVHGNQQALTKAGNPNTNAQTAVANVINSPAAYIVLSNTPDAKRPTSSKRVDGSYSPESQRHEAEKKVETKKEEQRTTTGGAVDVSA